MNNSNREHQLAQAIANGFLVRRDDDQQAWNAYWQYCREHRRIFIEVFWRRGRLFFNWNTDPTYRDAFDPPYPQEVRLTDEEYERVFQLLSDAMSQRPGSRVGGPYSLLDGGPFVPEKLFAALPEIVAIARAAETRLCRLVARAMAEDGMAEHGPRRLCGYGQRVLPIRHLVAAGAGQD